MSRHDTRDPLPGEFQPTPETAPVVLDEMAPFTREQYEHLAKRSDPARAAFVAQVREMLAEDAHVEEVLRETPTREYVRLHGWPETLRAIAEALDE